MEALVPGAYAKYQALAAASASTFRQNLELDPTRFPTRGGQRDERDKNSERH
jgi:hypothetical protein